MVRGSLLALLLVGCAPGEGPAEEPVVDPTLDSDGDSCMAEAPDYVARYQQYAEQGFLVITLLAENRQSRPPSQSDLVAWADAYGITHPVVADADYAVATRFITGNTIALPSTSLLGPGASVIKRDRVISAADIERALPVP